MNFEKLAVYCSSSNVIDESYFQAARALGRHMAQNRWQLVYGGGMIGLMGEVAKTVKAHSGRTIGVTPEALHIDGVVNTIDDELIVTRDMHERKATMIALADGFVGMPGGFGTLEEMLEVMTLKQLGYHEKPIVFLNINGYYDRLLAMFETIYTEQFAKDAYRCLYHVAASVDDLLQYLHNYRPPQLPAKWFI